MRPDRDQLLERIATEGEALRRRRRAALAIGAVAVAVLAVGVPVVAFDGGGREAVVADDGGRGTATTREPTTTASTSSSTTATTSPAPPTTAPCAGGDACGVPGEVPPETAVPPRPEQPPTTAPPATCRNSHDPACGPLVWDPQPANAPATLTASPSATVARVGEEVAVQLVADDPDAPVGPVCGPAVGWGDDSGVVCPALCQLVHGDKFGPWDPPPPQPGHYETVERHVYTTPGTYTISVHVGRGMVCDDPYGSQASQTFTINVSP